MLRRPRPRSTPYSAATPARRSRRDGDRDGRPARPRASARATPQPPPPPAPRQRHQVVSGEALPVTQLLLAPPAELAPVVVAGEEEGVGHLAPEPARHVDELDEADDRRPRNRQALALHDRSLRLDDLRLTVDHEPQGPAHGHHGQRLE